MTNITILGLGAMGTRIATRIADAGHAVTVWNRSPGPAETLAAQSTVAIAASPDKAVSTADIIITVVADDRASRALWLDPGHGVLDAMPGDAIAIESSTITEGLARELGAAAASRGIAFLEAPLIGSRPQAEAGALFVLVGGSEDALERSRSIIDSYAGGIRHVGVVGNAATMKLAVNGLFAAQVAAFAEVVGLLDRSNVPVDTAVEILTKLPITSPALQRILGLFSARDYAPNFPIPLVAKDLSYLLDLAAGLDASTPIITTTHQIYEAGARDQTELDIAGIADRYLD